MEYKYLHKRIRRVCIIITTLLLILFLYKQHFSINEPLDVNVFGCFGDVLSGVLGSIIGLYSIHLLVETLRNQISVNVSIITANESTVRANTAAMVSSEQQYAQTQLQLFDNRFQNFLEVYQNAINNYTNGEDIGRNAFEKITKQFIDNPFENHNEYRRRSRSAIENYLEFYSENRTAISVHLRILYLMVSMISNSELGTATKVEYAKLVRGQLSDAEMLIMRYNCLSDLGKKMRDYSNEYNLTKHISMIRLLEMKKYRNILDKYAIDNREKEETLLNGLDMMFIELRKKSVRMLSHLRATEGAFKTSHRYTISLDTNEPQDVFTIDVKKVNTERRGGGYRISAAEKALDLFSNTELMNLFLDFAIEVFDISNFGCYNKGVTINANVIEEKDNQYEFGIIISNNGKRLVLSYDQMKERDNPVGTLK